MRRMNLKCLGIVLVMVFGICLIPKRAAAQDNIPFSVVSNGGAKVTGAAYSIGGTVGQSFSGTAGNSTDVTDDGFWYLRSYTLTGVRSRPAGAAKEFMLFQNYPNPFNPTTEIRYQIREVSNVSLKIYDILGREVATLVNQKENPGSYSITFDGSRFASGIYFYRLVAGNYTATKKLVLIK